MAAHFHTFTHDALGNSDAVELSQKLRRREVSPAELANAAIARAKQADPTLHCIEGRQFDNPAITPLRLDQTFSGIPSFIKDNLPVKGFATTFGSQAIPHHVEKKHDPYAEQYLKLGFTLLGKSSLPEFGLNATTEPVFKDPTPNPWNLAYSAGASSGGAGALVAAGIVPIAHGNDGGGSIRIPAACCGLVGLKPSRGRHINSLAAKSLPINIVSEGVLTRSVRDTAYFHFEAEKVYRNKKLPEIPLITSPGKRRLKIGVLFESVTGVDTDAETQSFIANTASTLSALGHSVKEIRHPLDQGFSDDFAHYWAMMAFMLKKAGKYAINKGFEANKLDALTHGLADYYKERALKTPLTLYRLRQHTKRFLGTFSNVDVILTPTLGHAPAPLGHLSPTIPYEELFERLRAYVGFTPPANVAGTPAISLPGGLSQDHTPIGIQLISNIGREDLLLELAYELETHQPWEHLYQITE